MKLQNKIPQFKNEIEIIEKIISDLKNETQLDFTKNNIKIVKDKQFNMWCNPYRQKIKVSTRFLEEMKRGFLIDDEVKTILYHEFGHAKKEPEIERKWYLLLGFVSAIPALISIIFLFIPLIALSAVILTIGLMLLLGKHHREWEKMADNYAMQFINQNTLKAIIEKTSVFYKKTYLMKRKPFCYFRMGLTKQERLENINNFIKKNIQNPLQ